MEKEVYLEQKNESGLRFRAVLQTVSPSRTALLRDQGRSPLEVLLVLS